MIWIIGLVLASVPLVAFYATMRVSGRRYALAIVVAGLVGGCLGAFLASAGSAMATSVSPTDAMLRGGTIGFLGGAGVGILAALLSWFRQTQSGPGKSP